AAPVASILGCRRKLPAATKATSAHTQPSNSWLTAPGPHRPAGSGSGGKRTAGGKNPAIKKQRPVIRQIEDGRKKCIGGHHTPSKSVLGNFETRLGTYKNQKPPLLANNARNGAPMFSYHLLFLIFSTQRSNSQKNERIGCGTNFEPCRSASVK